jgi:hypothetical protein
MEFLKQEFPQLVEGYERLYPGAYAPKEYAKIVKDTIHAFERRYDVRRRPENSESDDLPSNTPEEVEQRSFDWRR